MASKRVNISVPMELWDELQAAKARFGAIDRPNVSAACCRGIRALVDDLNRWSEEREAREEGHE